MLHTTTNTTARHVRFLARARGFAARLADDELALALRAAGASSEDVERCLAGRTTRFRGTRRVGLQDGRLGDGARLACVPYPRDET